MDAPAAIRAGSQPLQTPALAALGLGEPKRIAALLARGTHRLPLPVLVADPVDGGRRAALPRFDQPPLEFLAAQAPPAVGSALVAHLTIRRHDRPAGAEPRREPDDDV